MLKNRCLYSLRMHSAKSSLAAALLATSAAASAATPEGTLVVAVNQEPQDLVAQGTYKEINAPWLQNVVEPLIAFDPVSDTFKGILATAWEVVDDNTVWMNLREGVSFHDGTPFNAESAAHAINLDWSADDVFTIQEYLGPGTITATPIGEYSIEIVSSEPDSLLDRLSLNGISWMRQIGDNPATPIGTGPYTVMEWLPGEYWSAEFNSDWWGLSAEDAHGAGAPAFQELLFVFRPEDGARTASAVGPQIERHSPLNDSVFEKDDLVPVHINFLPANDRVALDMETLEVMAFIHPNLVTSRDITKKVKQYINGTSINAPDLDLSDWTGTLTGTFGIIIRIWDERDRKGTDRFKITLNGT